MNPGTPDPLYLQSRLPCSTSSPIFHGKYEDPDQILGLKDVYRSVGLEMVSFYVLTLTTDITLEYVHDFVGVATHI